MKRWKLSLAKTFSDETDCLHVYLFFFFTAANIDTLKQRISQIHAT